LKWKVWKSSCAKRTKLKDATYNSAKIWKKRKKNCFA
jgi:hypothetical protein